MPGSETPLSGEELLQIPEAVFDGSGPIAIRNKGTLTILHDTAQNLAARRLRRSLERLLKTDASIRLKPAAPEEIAHWHNTYHQMRLTLAQEAAPTEPKASASAEPKEATRVEPKVSVVPPPEKPASAPVRRAGPVQPPELVKKEAAAPTRLKKLESAEIQLEAGRATLLPPDLYNALPETITLNRNAIAAMVDEAVVVLHEPNHGLTASRLQRACVAHLKLDSRPPIYVASKEQIAALLEGYAALSPSADPLSPATEAQAEEERDATQIFDVVEASVQRRILEPDSYEMIPPGLRAAETVVLVKENEDDLVILHSPKALLAARRMQQACKTHLKMEATLHSTEGLIIRSFRDAYALRENPENIEKKSRGLLEDEASKTDVGRTVKDIIQHAAVLQATDIHIEARMRPNNMESVAIRYRVSGDLTEGPTELSGERGAQVANWLFSQGRRNNPQWVRHAILDGVADVSIVDPLGGGMRQVQLRLANLPEVRGWDMVIRILNPGQNVIGLRQLGYETLQLDLLREAFSRPYGIIVFSGPTGSGKSTSMLAALETLPANLKIVSLEQPVERPLANTSHVTTRDEAELARAIPSVNRWDGNITVLGELRDQPSARALKDFTTSGKLTVVTLHASNALTVPTRMAELSVEWSMLADPNFLVALINQRLVSRLCPACSVPLQDHWDQVPSYRRQDFNELFGTGEGIFLRGEGCSQRGCRKGAIGRVLCAEIVLVDDRDRAFIETQSLRDWKKDLLERGWMSIAAHALQRARNGEIDPVACEQAVGPLSGSVENVVNYRARAELLRPKPAE